MRANVKHILIDGVYLDDKACVSGGLVKLLHVKGDHALCDFDEMDDDYLKQAHLCIYGTR